MPVTHPALPTGHIPSVVIVAKNEARTIAECIKGASFADETLVLRALLPVDDRIGALRNGLIHLSERDITACPASSTICNAEYIYYK